MLSIQSFTFFPDAFAENTYVLFDETRSAVVIDPGCYHRHEKDALRDYIKQNDLKLELVLNTHCHIDHILGNAMLVREFGVPLLAHKEDLYNLVGAETFARMYGMQIETSPEPNRFIIEGEVITFGNTQLEVLFTPGHSSGHVSFFHRESKQVFSGDVLFKGSVGRTDLPGGDSAVLIRTIVEKLFPLGDDVKVYAGHMEPTTIGHEKKFNSLVAQMKAAYLEA